MRHYSKSTCVFLAGLGFALYRIFLVSDSRPSVVLTVWGLISAALWVPAVRRCRLNTSA